jgi:hypothetical protein
LIRAFQFSGYAISGKKEDEGVHGTAKSKGGLPATVMLCDKLKLVEWRKQREKSQPKKEKVVGCICFLTIVNTTAFQPFQL